MTYELFIGDRSFSSWSLRGWLMLARFGLPVQVHMTGLYTGTFAEDLAPLAPARFVPVLRTPEGDVVGDTLAIAETLAERHPQAGLWPESPGARGLARWLCAEMHSGFTSLRESCPMMLRHAWQGFAAPDSVRADVQRTEELWQTARGRHGSDDSPWLFGRYSLADVFYAPVAARIATYRLYVGTEARAYVDAHLSDEEFRQWRALGQAAQYESLPYGQDLPKASWPGPARRTARAAPEGPSENAACPYSGRPVTHFLETGGRVFGFCNAGCRDKTVADPDAWPAFRALIERSC